MKAVHIQCLDVNKNPLKHAYGSGFLLQEEKKLFLYTCWHVVTGYNMHDLKIGHELPDRRFIKVSLQNCEKPQQGVTIIGGSQSYIFPLYDENDKPLWKQNQKDVPNEDLNAINIKVPFWHDAVKLTLPSNIPVSDSQVIKKDETWKSLTTIGEKIYIVGYPYGFSAVGMKQPTPIVLTRFIAADKILERHAEVLLDGPGAGGMSGGPAFIERGEALYLLGMYTGIIYPDHIIEKHEKSTALGSCCNMVLWWNAEEEI